MSFSNSNKIKISRFSENTANFEKYFDNEEIQPIYPPQNPTLTNKERAQLLPINRQSMSKL